MTFFKDFFKPVYDFSFYKTLEKRGALHTFLFVLVILLLGGGLTAAVTSAFLKTAVPETAKNMPAVKYEKGVLTLNDGNPLTFPLYVQPDGQSALNVVYDPALTFPPTLSDFKRQGAVIFLNKTNIFMLNGFNNIESANIEELLKAYGVEDDSFSFTTADIEKRMPELLGSLDFVVSFSAGAAYAVFLGLSVLLAAVCGLAVNIFMGKNISFVKILKLSCYMQLPVMLILFLVVFIFKTVFFLNFWLMFICIVYFTRVLSYYPGRRG